MKFARSWVGRHAITVQILALSVLVFTGLRAALMLRHVSLAEASVWELARVMWIGLRFDLLTAGILRKNADGKIEFPFDAVHVDFLLKAA